MNDGRIIKQEKVGKYLVSTVRLGIDHGWDGTPLWYETMVFHANEKGDVIDWGDLYCDRYTTVTQAQEGHEEVVRKLSNGKLTLHE